MKPPFSCPPFENKDDLQYIFYKENIYSIEIYFQ